MTLVLSGSELEAYASRLGWSLESSKNVISIPSNPDNQIESTVVQESIKLPRRPCPLKKITIVTYFIFLIDQN